MSLPDQKKVAQRADELEEFTRLSEMEAKVWFLAREWGAQPAEVVSNRLGIEESTVYEYDRRAREKIQKARATVALAGEGSAGPYTEDFVGPVTVDEQGDSIESLTPAEIEGEIEACDHWIEMGIEEIGGTQLRDARERLQEAQAD